MGDEVTTLIFGFFADAIGLVDDPWEETPIKLVSLAFWLAVSGFGVAGHYKRTDSKRTI